MKYTIKSGTLYKQDLTLAYIKGILTGPEKKIFSSDGKLIFKAYIQQLDAPDGKRGDIRFRRYILSDSFGNTYALASPDYATGEDPDVIGWPIYRMPKADHAELLMDNHQYCLFMRNSQNYILEKSTGEHAVQIFHRGLIGGWDIDATDDISPAILCGIFIFCRYLEQENEFLVV